MSVLRAALAVCAGWGEPRVVAGNPFRLACRLDEAATAGEIDAAWPTEPPPDALIELWMLSRQSELFVDVDHGQWGMSLLSPDESAARSLEERRSRPDDFDARDPHAADAHRRRSRRGGLHP